MPIHPGLAWWILMTGILEAGNLRLISGLRLIPFPGRTRLFHSGELVEAMDRFMFFKMVQIFSFFGLLTARVRLVFHLRSI